ncbi:uncharacterized protein LY89DRAFT_612003 [Mollisia scopiformis]|uniref:Uncharacterized protein n=1 Tax=Mollisia scopiformis TaxID=149040 RepID=A0A194XIN2_MOLSC|nr:uncharacterized protein LY89DRAFT_612003 [Mollisia scopiformis]KUJ19991.1 hypothetical protein LY89DRAFT_612003 [Mollisia scopiformis]
MHHSCYTYTTTVPFTGIINCPLQTTCGPEPMCIKLNKATLEVPCANSRCPKTPTATVTAWGVCPTCRKGCGTDIITETVKTGCHPTTFC